MKTLISIFAIIILLLPSKESSFCNGYSEGYKQGYCYQIYGCQEPIPPQCPLPNIDETTYKHGYNRGFSEGREAQPNN